MDNLIKGMLLVMAALHFITSYQIDALQERVSQLEQLTQTNNLKE